MARVLLLGDIIIYRSREHSPAPGYRPCCSTADIFLWETKSTCLWYVTDVCTLLEYEYVLGASSRTSLEI